MFQAVIVIFKRLSCVIGWVNKHAFHFARKFLFEGFQGKQVVAVDEAVIKFSILAAGSGVVAFFGVFQKDARFQLGAFVLAYPGEFEFLVFHAFAVS